METSSYPKNRLGVKWLQVAPVLSPMWLPVRGQSETVSHDEFDRKSASRVRQQECDVKIESMGTFKSKVLSMFFALMMT